MYQFTYATAVYIFIQIFQELVDPRLYFGFEGKPLLSKILLEQTEQGENLIALSPANTPDWRKCTNISDCIQSEHVLWFS